MADAASFQAELQASQLQQQLDALLSEQQAGQEELQQAQGQAAEAQSRCTELETQLASIQAQAGAYQEAAGRAMEEQQAAQEARASLESQLQQLEAQLKAFQDLPAQMAHAEAAHAQVTDPLCLSLIWAGSCRCAWQLRCDNWLKWDTCLHLGWQQQWQTSPAHMPKGSRDILPCCTWAVHKLFTCL